MSLVRACAFLAERVYEREPRVEDLGLTPLRQYDRDSSQALLACDDRYVYLSYRGSDNQDIKDYLRDLNYPKRDFPGGGRIHEGFYEALEPIWTEIVKDLRLISLPLVVGGHSLGGAMAVYTSRLTNTHQTHVFGCPSVGNDVFTNDIPDTLYSHEAWFDVVTYLPPPVSPWQAWHAWRNDRAPTRYRRYPNKVRVNSFGHSMRGYAATYGLPAPE